MYVIEDRGYVLLFVLLEYPQKHSINRADYIYILKFAY